MLILLEHLQGFPSFSRPHPLTSGLNADFLCGELWLTICLEGKRRPNFFSHLPLHTVYANPWILGLCLPCWLTGLLQGYRWPGQQENPHTWRLAYMCEGVLYVWFYVSYHGTAAANWRDSTRWSNQEQHKSRPSPSTIHHMAESRERESLEVISVRMWVKFRIAMLWIQFIYLLSAPLPSIGRN